jgi:tetratricopeptide (TPR) repeat protein
MAGNIDNYQKAMNLGHSAAWDRMWEQAALFYRQAMKEFPDDAKVLTSLGMALFELLRYEDSLTCYRRAAVVTPEDPLPAEKIAQICERLGRLNDATRSGLQAADLYIKNREVEKAIENWNRITRFNPENLTAHTRLGMVYERLGRKSEAVKEYIAVAALMQLAKDMVKAAQAVSYALQIQPDSSEARQALMILKSNQMLPKPTRTRGGTGPVLMSQVRKKGIGESESINSESDLLDPVTEARQKALVSLADILFEQTDDTNESASSRRGLTSIAGGASNQSTDAPDRSKIVSHLSQAVEAQTQEDFTLAAAELLRAIDAGLSRPGAFFDLGYLYHELNQWDNVLPNLRVSVKSQDYALASHLLLGSAQRKLGKLAEAALEYLQALKIADTSTVPPEYADSIRQLYEPLIDAQLRQQNENSLKTICTNIEQQLKRPDWRDYMEKARQQMSQNSTGDGPLPVAEILLQANSLEVVHSLAKIRSLSQKNQIRTAMEEAYFALLYAPNYLPLHIQMGELLIQDDHIQDAVQKLMTVARAYNVRGDIAQATQLLRRVIQLTPMDLTLRSQLIESLCSQDHPEEALQSYVELAEIYYRMADLENARKTYLAALRFAQQAPDMRNWTVKILTAVGDIDIQRMDWRQALRVFEQIRTLQPGDEKTRFNLVDLNFRMGQESAAQTEMDSYLSYLESKAQRSKGIQFMQWLISDHPEKVDLHRRLSELYRQNNQIEEAISELDLIGDLLISAGNNAGAITIIQSIMDLNPPNANDYRRLLNQLKSKQ